jgi:nicotinamide mononucleotide adenylyltransferase
MFEMAADYVKFNKTEFELMGGYLSPVSDLYKKAGLASSQHRYDDIITILKRC